MPTNPFVIRKSASRRVTVWVNGQVAGDFADAKSVERDFGFWTLFTRITAVIVVDKDDKVYEYEGSDVTYAES